QRHPRRGCCRVPRREDGPRPRSDRDRRLEDRAARGDALPARRYAGIGRSRPPDPQRPRGGRGRRPPARWGWTLKAAIRRRLETVQTHTLVAAAFLALAIVM